MAKQQRNKIDLLEVYKTLRKVWFIKPATRIVKYAKPYSRKNEKQNFIKELRNE